jgi:hypothetical protein
MVLHPQNPEFGSTQTASETFSVTSGAEDEAPSRFPARSSAFTVPFGGDGVENISGALYWEIVMGSAEDAQTAEATVNEVVSALQGIGTL